MLSPFSWLTKMTLTSWSSCFLRTSSLTSSVISTLRPCLMWALLSVCALKCISAFCAYHSSMALFCHYVKGATFCVGNFPLSILNEFSTLLHSALYSKKLISINCIISADCLTVWQWFAFSQCGAWAGEKNVLGGWSPRNASLWSLPDRLRPLLCVFHQRPQLLEGLFLQ